MYKKLPLLITFAFMNAALFAAQQSQVPNTAPQEETVLLKLSNDRIVEINKKYIPELETLNNIIEDLGRIDDSVTLSQDLITQKSLQQLQLAIDQRTQEQFLEFAQSLNLFDLAHLIVTADYLALKPYKVGVDKSFKRLDLLYEVAAQKIIMETKTIQNQSDGAPDLLKSELSKAIELLNGKESVGNAIAQKIFPCGWFLYRTLEQNKSVTAAHFSYDSSRIVSVSSDKTANIWAVQTENKRLVLQHNAVVSDARFNHDNTRIITASFDGMARVWDATTGALLFVLKHDEKVSDAQFSPDNTYIATAGRSKAYAYIWSAEKDTLLHTLNHDHNIVDIQFSPDSKSILSIPRGRAVVKVDSVTIVADKSVRVWKTQTGTLGYELPHSNLIKDASFSPDSSGIATASCDKTAKLWDAHNGALRFTLPHSDVVNKIRYSSDNKLVLTACDDKTAKVWDAVTGTLLVTLQHSEPVTDAQISSDNSFTVTVSTSQRSWNAKKRYLTCSSAVQLWNTKKGSMIGELIHEDDDQFQAQLSPDNKYILIISHRAKNPQLWLNYGAILKELGRSLETITLPEALDFYHWTVIKKQPAQNWKYRSANEKHHLTASKTPVQASQAAQPTA